MIGNRVRSPTLESGAVSPATVVTRTSRSGLSAPVTVSAATRISADAPTAWSRMISLVRPCRSSSAPTMGLSSSPGATLVNVTIPARVGEPNRSSANSTIATPSMLPPIRLRAMPSRIRPMAGISSSAR